MILPDSESLDYALFLLYFYYIFQKWTSDWSSLTQSTEQNVKLYWQA